MAFSLTVLATIRDYQFVNCKPFWARNLNQHAAAIRHGGGYRIGDQEVQMVDCLRAHVERRQRPHALGVVKARRQELDQKIAARLAPSPGFLVLNCGAGSKEKSFRIDCRGGDASSSSARDSRSKLAMSMSSGLRGLIEFVAKAEFAFVEPEGLRADERAAQPENAGLGEGVEQRAGRCVNAEKPFSAQDADLSRAGRLSFSAPGCQFPMAREPGADLVAVLADIRLAHVRADAKRVVPVDLAVAARRGSACRAVRRQPRLSATQRGPA